MPVTAGPCHKARAEARSDLIRPKEDTAMRLPARLALLAPTLLLGLAAIGCAGGPASKDSAPTARGPLADCLDPNRARGWVMVDGDQLLVDAGRHFYRIELSFSCPELANSQQLYFKPSNGIGRVCGNAGDAVFGDSRTRLGPGCQIAKLVPISREDYYTERNRSRGEVSAEEPVSP